MPIYKNLLIVPYGIETSIFKSLWVQKVFLLIVPYGIETLLSSPSSCSIILLIVPYGIETLFRTVNPEKSFSF